MTSTNVLGVPVTGWTPDHFLDQVLVWAGGGHSSQTVFYANAHVLNTAYTNPELLDELRLASTVYCDGSGVRLGARLLGKSLPGRMTGADWIDPLCERIAQAGLSVFLLGGAGRVAAEASRILVGRHPRLRIVGEHHGFGGPDSDEWLVDLINRSGPTILLVGMGTPRQELWIRKHRKRLVPPVVWAIGALLDFVTGVERRGPRWMVNHHLEWLARLQANPARLWRRYLIGNPLFVARVLRQRVFGLPPRLIRDVDETSV